MSMFKVAIHYGADERGFVAYDTETKELTVTLPEQEWADKVTAFLKQDHSIAHAMGLDTYQQLEIDPLESLGNLKLALTRLWEATEVQVDWSRPVDM
ncbi:MAG: hypothetical protein HUJ84_03950 [Veillonella sp.]|nr:hypothetical protein [Veillonella sp.]MCF0156488.1 hypothetical protein [Veillonella sp.]